MEKKEKIIKIFRKCIDKCGGIIYTSIIDKRENKEVHTLLYRETEFSSNLLK